MGLDKQVVDAEQLIVKHLDLWTSAQTAKSTAGRGSNNKFELTGIKKLRELILELAVRGKLVPQDPNDEPASELLKRIAAENDALVKAGKLKKQKPLSPLNREEISFEIPVGWALERVGNLFNVVYGKGISTSELTEDGYQVFGANGIIGKYPSYNYEDIQLLMSCRGAYSGKPNISPPLCLVTSNSLILENTWNYLSLRYCFYFFEVADKSEIVTGSAQPQVTTTNLNPFLIKIPPLNEQIRIVAKVDDLMALCDQLEQQSYQSIDAHNQLVDTLLQTLVDSANADELASNWQRLSEHFDTLFTTEYSIDALKQTILQLAVMGKLVKQDPTDEPASELLKRIAKEKEALVKAGKIKKQKPLPQITDDEKPFELPEGWEWCRISNLALSCDYGTSQKSSESEGGIPVISMGQIQAGVVLTENLKRVPHDTPDIDDLFLKKGDLLYNRTNSAELVGKTGMFSGSDDLYTYASYLIRIRLPTNLVSPYYLNAVMNSPKFRELEINPHVKQQCGQANVNGTIMQSMRIPLPPYAEQLSVIAKVEELTALSNQFVSQLNMTKKTLITLTTSLLGRVMS